jgi:hypothetical protein
MTGPKAALSVRVYEETTASKQPQATAATATAALARQGPSMPSAGVSIPPQTGVVSKPRV